MRLSDSGAGAPITIFIYRLETRQLNNVAESTALATKQLRGHHLVPENASSQGSRRLSICLVCPRFEPSFFGMEYALPVLPGDKRAASFPGALPLLAGLAPAAHDVTLVDENIEQLDFDYLSGFDVVGVTGMIVQKKRMHEILTRLLDAGPMVCVGGPYVTVNEGYFDGLCHVKFIGEADVTWPQFLNDLAAGKPTKQRYEQDVPTDMASLPCPRYDLVNTARYLTATTQFSRGCPFMCEFCDIIVIFGRKPRLKTPDQIVQEMDALHALGVRSVFFVDDNFIGNKPRAKALLKVLVNWQTARGYPMTFSTEATVNLGDEPEMLNLLWQANFRSVFIGIESPRAESLLETRKIQNVRGDSVEAKLERIRNAGLVIQAGFIVGFDNDDESIFDEQFAFAQRTGIGTPFVSVLSPIPSTPLYARLEQEGRLRLDDELVWFEPKRLSRDRLRGGYHELNSRLYATSAFFERVFGQQLRSVGYQNRRHEARRDRSRSGSRCAAAWAVLTMAYRLVRELARHKKLASVGGAYLAAWWRRNLGLGRDALDLAEFLALCARHWHCLRISAQSRSNWGA
jgi:radical SAM superfamily enzyme YgiQ (UPF0313 family)